MRERFLFPPENDTCHVRLKDDAAPRTHSVLGGLGSTSLRAKAARGRPGSEPYVSFSVPESEK
jgi:hypothetical protein